MTNSLFGIKAFMKAVVNAEPWRKDPLELRKPWGQEAYQLAEHGGGRELVFAILWDDRNVVPHQPVRRALELTKAALIAAGHKVIDWVPHKHGELCAVARAIWLAGSTDDYAAVTALTGEPVISTMRLDLGGLPSSKTRSAVPPSKTISAYDLWQIHKQRSVLRKEYLDHWEATVAKTGTDRPVDAIISPVAPYAAPPHGENRNADYTTIWNCLDYPALVFPVTKVDPMLDAKQPAHEFLSEEDKKNYALYAPETFKDAPVGLQLIGRTQEEEAVIAMCEIVDKALVTRQAKL